MMKARGKIQSWEISDKFWEKVKNLIPKKERVPEKEYKRAAGAGFFQKIWELGLEEYDEMYGIGWEWQFSPYFCAALNNTVQHGQYEGLFI